MKTGPSPKAPRQAVLILGVGYGALKVAKTIVESGLPAVWATRAHHFLEISPAGRNSPEWPADLVFQFRPLYLRVTRHPLLTPLTRASLKSIKKTRKGYRAVLEQSPRYIDYNLCTGCGRCFDVCPLNDGLHPPLTRSPAYCPSRALELDKRHISPCRQACPLGVNAQAYLALTAVGRFEEALAVIRRDNPLPGVCGRVCHHPCEEACRRSELDQPLSIRALKRFLFDEEAQGQAPRLEMPKAERLDRKVAVIGSGPAGLTAAHFLNQAGVFVVVFEAMPEAGGQLRAGINAFRLPRRVLDAEIKALVDSGIEIRTNHLVLSNDDLLALGFDVVLLTTGTHEDLKLNIPGEELKGVRHCLNFLKGLNLDGSSQVGSRTIVIGGGNSAMDAARCALRLGAAQVTVVAIEREGEMPAHPQEIREAKEEGVEFVLGAAPIVFEGPGQVAKVVCRPAHWVWSEAGPAQLVFEAEETFYLEADMVIVAIGQRPHLDRIGLDRGLTTIRGGRLAIDDGFQTSRPGIFAAGDVVTGPSTVINAMAAGRQAASRILEALTGRNQPEAYLDLADRGVGDYVEIAEDIPRQPRQEMSQRQPRVRRRDFEEVDFGLTGEQAMTEAKRCLQCGSCCECRLCETVCEEIGAIDHFQTGRTFEIDVPAVIVTDGEEWPGDPAATDGLILKVPDIKDETDLMSLMMAGTAAAGQAMTKAIDLRRQVRPSKPVARPTIDTDRLGFFLCTCNQTMAPPAALDRIRDLAAAIPGLVHSQLIFSACHPRGSELIAESVRRNKIGRVILASCLCCPLEFQCISCNDQRTRARLHLFNRLGLARSRFETINLRDHFHTGQDVDEVVERARAFLRAAVIRSRYLGPLQQGSTQIGRQVLILGGSAVGISCAENLALQGFKVKIVHRGSLPGRALPAEIAARPIEAGLSRAITQIEEAEISEIDGYLGHFTVRAREGGSLRGWKADVVCLTDENLVSLAVPTGKTGLKKFYRYDFAFFHSPQGGLYRVLPVTLNRVSPGEAGAALAAEVSTVAAEAYINDNQLSPVIDPERCRGCGRCVDICPFKAVRLKVNDSGLYTAEVLRHNCVGCGGCVGRCPVTAMDMPYFSNQVLNEIVAGALTGER